MSENPTELRALPLLEARELSLSIGGLNLLRESSFSIQRGELVVLVGASGTGKTVLLRMLSGVLRPDGRNLVTRGGLQFEGLDLLRTRPKAGKIGIVFQNHALFDELNALQNVRFAEHHRRRTGNPPRGKELLEHLGIRPGASLRTMSGGQLQRLALARTLALEPELILYDEPTTGLDPANGEKVAALIAETHRETHATSLVVTHDIETLVPIADRVLLLNAVDGRIEEVPADEVGARLRALQASIPAVSDPPVSTRPGIGTRLLEGAADFVLQSASAVLHLIPTAPRPLYGLRYLWHYLGLSASFGSFVYFGISGLIIGFVATYFTFEHLPERGFTEPLFIDDILKALGFMLYRVLCPVILTILVAARMGAAFASDIGNKVYSRQFDALRSFGIQPSRYVLTSALWSVLISVPLLYAAMFLCARAISLIIFVYGHADETYFFWERNFHRALRIEDSSLWIGTSWLFWKLQLCAFGTAAIAWFEGTREKVAADDVSRAVTRTIIWASLWTLLVHFVFAFFEF